MIFNNFLGFIAPQQILLTSDTIYFTLQIISGAAGTLGIVRARRAEPALF
jgi:hypothetical protein